jgi:hypothetical protein
MKIFDGTFWFIVFVFISLWVIAVANSQTYQGDLGPKLAKFNVPYGRLVREYYACPLNATLIDECKGEQFGVTDNKAYQDARNAAKKLFELEDPQ